MTNLTATQSVSLSLLSNINDQMLSVSKRIDTGKSVSSLLDGPATYLQAQRYDSRANSLMQVGKGIDLALSAVKGAQNGLDKVKKDLSDTLTTLKSLQGTTAASDTTSAGPQNVTLTNGTTRAATTERGTLQGSQQSFNVGLDKVAGNRKVFGSASANPTSTDDGSLGLGATPSTITVSFQVGTAPATSIDITTADASPGGLTVNDIVKKINSSSVTLSGGGIVTASISNTGMLQFSSTGSSFKAGINISGQAVGSSNTTFGLTAYATMTAATTVTGTTNLAGTGTFTSSNAPPTIRAAIQAKLKDIAVFDDNTVSTDNALSYNNTTQPITGNLGATKDGVVSLKLTAPGQSSTYVNVTQADLNGNNTTAGLAQALMAKLTAQGYTGPAVTVMADATTGALSVQAGAGVTVSFGQGADATAAQTSANTNGFNTQLGFTSGTQTVSLKFADLASASAISLLGTDSASFQEGDTFRIGVVDTRTGTLKSVYFKASNQDNITNTNATGASDNPLLFKSMADLVNGVKKMFDSSMLNAEATQTTNTTLTASNNTLTTTTPTSFQLRLTLGANAAMEIEQTVNAGAGTGNGSVNGVVQIRNSANALESIFGTSSDQAAFGLKSTTGTEIVLTSSDTRDSLTGSIVSHTDNFGKKISYVRNAAAASTTADPKRLATARSLAKILNQIDGTTTASQVSGAANLLKGTALNVATDDNRNTTFRLALDQALTSANLGFASASSIDPNGPPEVGYSDLTSGLSTDLTLNNVINKVQVALDNIEGMSSSLGTQAGTLVNSQNYVSALSKLMNEASDNLTKTDATADAAELKALDTRSSLAMGAFGILNNSIASVQQLLR